ncbi:MAG: DUF4397 domain-containing protein [Polyangiales bacterium]
MRSHSSFLSLLSLALVAGCQLITGVETRTYDPILDGCTLPNTGDAKVRFANLVSDDSAVDVCVRPSGGQFGRPLLRGAGSGCGTALGGVAGYKYGEASAPFSVASGKIDVRVILAGGTCSAPAIGEGNGISVEAGGVTTLVRMGDKPFVAGFPEDTVRAPTGNGKFRFIHAAPALGALDWGVTDTEQLPAQLGVPVLKTPLAFGKSSIGAEPGFGTINKNGYLETPGADINVGAAPTGQKKALLLTTVGGAEGGRTIYAIGDPGKPFFPVRALVCEDLETVGLRTKCALSKLGTISVDVFNAYLYGSFAPDENDRRPAVEKAIAERDSDLMCVVSLNRLNDRNAVIDLAKAQAAPKGFNYSYTSTTDLTTKATDPRDQNGTTPADYTTPPCGGTNTKDDVDAVIQCLQDNCSTTHTPDGVLDGGSACLSSKCAVPLIPFLGGDRDHHRCFGCLTTGSVGDLTHSQVRDRCQVQTSDFEAFDGQTSSIILSKYPLTDTDTFVLPSTLYRRVVHHAKAEVEKGKFVDFFCAEMTAAFGTLLPYYGNYAPASGTDPWFQEQLLQAQRTIEYVKKKAGTNPAIVTGDWAASSEYRDKSGAIVIDDQNGKLFDLFEPAGLHLALPKDFVPRCTECASPENPYNADKNIWQFRTFVLNLPATSGVEVGYFATDINAVTTKDGRKVPLSDRWGYNTKILRP